MLHPEVKHGKNVRRYDCKKCFATHVNANGCTWVTHRVRRHTLASPLASAGVSIYKIAGWLRARRRCQDAKTIDSKRPALYSSDTRPALIA